MSPKQASAWSSPGVVRCGSTCKGWGPPLNPHGGDLFSHLVVAVDTGHLFHQVDLPLQIVAGRRHLKDQTVKLSLRAITRGLPLPG